MTQIIKHPKHKLEIADILRQHVHEYRQAYPLLPEHKKIVSSVLNCRTAYLGGHIERCDTCGTKRVTYHSCRNRHCPKCQQLPRERWTEARKQELLPTSYFHVIFTLPHELHTIVLNSKSIMFALLLKAVSQTHLTFGKNELGGKLGFISVLHTWDQKLNAHFHLHCLIVGGAISNDGNRFLPCKKNYLFNQEALSLVFRGKYIDLLTRAVKRGEISFGNGYESFKNTLYTHKWVVSVRKPIKRPYHVLEYIARYTHRVAIANSRIKSLNQGKVIFNTKDRKKDKIVPVTVTALEFIRRFLLHSLPSGFVRIRHYGFLANRNRNANLDKIRHLLKMSSMPAKVALSIEEMVLKLTNIDITKCPCCKTGTMQFVTDLPLYYGKHPPIRPPNYKPYSL